MSTSLLGSGARFPAGSLGCLCLFLLQFARLPNLQHLELVTPPLAAGTDALLRLRGITYMNAQIQPSPALAEMTQLRHLELTPQGRPHEIAPQLDAALRQLQQLTALVLKGRLMLSIPPAVAGLRYLQRCMLGRYQGQPLGGPLPGGPWMASLRWLCADWEVLCASPVLVAADRLEYICVSSMPRNESQDFPLSSAAFWHWAATHPPLRRLSLQTHSAPLPPEVFDAVMALRDARPALVVHRCGCPQYPQFSCELNHS